MTPRELIAAFEVVADAPEGVKRLRELVLSLAVRGRLVQPHAGEWRTVPLTELTQEFQNGTSSRGGEGGQLVVVLRLADIKQGRIVESSFRRIDLAPASAAKYGVREGDILAIRVNGSADLVGRLIPVERNEGWCYCDHLIRIRLRPDTICPRFLTLFGNTNEARSHLSAVTVTTAGQKTVNQKGLGSLQVPVPPLDEQHRIVARLDELMALLDQLETARTTRDAARRAARDSALADLRDAPDAEAAETAWSRIARNMDDLFTEPEDVAPLRQAILQLAVWGRLVHQMPEDEPISLPSGRHSIQTPAWTPKTWASGPMEAWFEVVGGIQKSGKRSPGGNAWPYLRVANVQRGALDLREIARFELFEGELDRYRLRTGDLLVVEGNGSETEIGRCARWSGEIEDCVHQNHLIRCRPRVSGIERFILLYLNSPIGTAHMRALAVTTSGLFNLSVGKIRALPVVLPPLAEQHRIVAKVNTLMALCDDLEARLTASRALHGQLAAAAVHHLDM